MGRRPRAPWRRALEQARHRLPVNAGDGAFYGPKIDFQVRDALGREWQLGTVQLDYQLPLRFELAYIGADSAAHPPVMIHRAMLGSLERFLGILIEHTAGAFPLWLAPVQAVVIPVRTRPSRPTPPRSRAASGPPACASSSTRAARAWATEIREAQLQKVPYMLVVGAREQEARGVAVRRRSGPDLGTMPLPEFLARAGELVRSRRPRALVPRVPLHLVYNAG